MLDAKQKGSYSSGMSKLDQKARAQIISLLCEGMSIRAITRLTGASKNTVAKLLVAVGHAVTAYQDKALRNLKSERVQIDEIWSFIYCKNDNVKRAKSAPAEAGDVWTWTAIDADSKLLVSWYLGARDTDAAMHFLTDLRSRLANRIQLTSDGHRPYLQAVDSVFGEDVDYAMLNKIYGADPQGQKRYSPAKCIGAEKRPITGNPDKKYISTSYAERANLTMRMHMRRFTRLTNAFSKKIENHAATIALHSMFYNFVRIHQTLKVTPAMAAGVTDKLWEISDIVQVLEDFESQRKAEPSFEIERERIGQGYFVRATLTNGTPDTVYGFATEADAAKWIRNESVVWLYERRNKKLSTAI
jgi:IS1 family transposase